MPDATTTTRSPAEFREAAEEHGISRWMHSGTSISFMTLFHDGRTYEIIEIGSSIEIRPEEGEHRFLLRRESLIGGPRWILYRMPPGERDVKAENSVDRFKDRWEAIRRVVEDRDLDSKQPA